MDDPLREAMESWYRATKRRVEAESLREDAEIAIRSAREAERLSSEEFHSLRQELLEPKVT